MSAVMAMAPRPRLPMVSFRTPVLPWAIAPDDERRLKKVARVVLLAAALVCIVTPWLPVHKVERPEVASPPHAVRLLIDMPPPPPLAIPKPTPPEPLRSPPTPAREQALAPPDPVKSVPSKAAAPAKVAINKEALVPEARVPLPDKAPGEVDAVRRKVAGIGLLAMKDTLNELHGAPTAVQLAPVKQGPGVGSGTGVGVGAGNEAGLPVRALINSDATGGSGGINTAGYSRNSGGGGLAGRATTLVEGAIGGGGGGGAGGGGARGRGDGNGSGHGGTGGTGTASAGGTLQRGGSGKASRSIEDVKLVFERNKGAIYAIYNRALREEPSLQGKVVLKLTIAPSGGVVDCRIESSELKTPELEAKLLARIRQFDFGAKDVDQMIVTWPVDFLPS